MKRVVILRALKLGDLLTAVPALRAIARAFPGHERVLAAPAWLGPLVDHLGVVDRLVPTEPLAPLDRELHRADVAVNLHGRGPASTALLAATNPRRLISFGVRGGPQWRAGEHERARWCRLLTESGIAADPDDLRIEPPAVVPPVIGRSVVHPGASTASRRWPPARWAAVAAALPDPVITGTAAERSLCEHVAELAGLGRDRVAAGCTDLLELLAVVAAAEVVVCGDTGVAHVASALGRPSVVLFGPVSPMAWGPPPWGPHTALWAGSCGDPNGDAGPHPGLLELTVADVLAAAAAKTSSPS